MESEPGHSAIVVGSRKGSECPGEGTTFTREGKATGAAVWGFYGYLWFDYPLV